MPELTVAQALIRFLAAQHVQRDGESPREIRRDYLRPVTPDV